MYLDESGMDNRDEYDYGWNEKGQRFHALKSGRRQGRVNMIAGLCIPLLSLSGRAIARSLMRQSIQAILLEKNGSCICY